MHELLTEQMQANLIQCQGIFELRLSQTQHGNQNPLAHWIGVIHTRQMTLTETKLCAKHIERCWNSHHLLVQSLKDLLPPTPLQPDMAGYEADAKARTTLAYAVAPLNAARVIFSFSAAQCASADRWEEDCRVICFARWQR